MSQKKLADGRVLRNFAIGQLGWATLSGVVSNWLLYFYMPSEETIAAGMPLFITQGIVFAGMTIIGLITAFCRLVDGFIDPYIASKSDSLSHPLGRRIPFMRWFAIPFGIMTVVVFTVPGLGGELFNDIALFVCLVAFYVSLSLYCTPFNALIPELGRTQELRVNLSTYISVTYFIGTAVAYLVPTIAGFFQASFGIANAYRMTIGILAAIAIVCMLIPAFTIDENVYAETEPSTTTMGASVVKTFKNKEFQVFEISDILYWVAITMFQTGMPFYVTSLIGLDESWNFILFAGMTVLSLVFYAPVNILAKRLGKKTLVSFAFFFFCLAFLVTSVCGQFGVPELAWGALVAILAAIPMAILGILPQAVLADIAESDAVETGENREGMFYAARTFSMTLGQSLAMILFSSIATVGTGGFGYRITAIVATVFCLLGGLVFMRYREARVLQVIGAVGSAAAKKLEGEEE
ncbi:MAG: MFS transporter [Atopobiaceae bacterium]|jgi:GPH family glycoside/pentoside/hexuronide:cation symporter|nr:MFS transporter [Atopobiaceae bacterium]